MQAANWLCLDIRVTLTQEQVQWAVDRAFDLVATYPNRDMLTGAISADLEMLMKSIVQERTNGSAKDARIAELEAERDRLARELAEAQRLNRQSICVYCGHIGEGTTRENLTSVMAAHIAECPKHPLNRVAEAVDAATTELRSELAETRKDTFRIEALSRCVVDVHQPSSDGLKRAFYRDPRATGTLREYIDEALALDAARTGGPDAR